MSKINWRLMVFIGALWWFVYSAPTEESLIAIFTGNATSVAASADDF